MQALIDSPDGLDISFVTDKIAVMGSFYSNDTLPGIRSYLQRKHQQHYMVYNLSSEPEYNIEQDIENVHNFPFNANNPCALKVLMSICSEIDSYLALDHQNVAFLHCRTGLGRSCMIAACYLLHSGVLTAANKAVEFVNQQRRPGTLDALTCPSQIRYVHYYEALLRSGAVQCGTYQIKHIRLRTVPSFSSSLIECGCSPTVSISLLARPGQSKDVSTPWYPRRVFHQADHLMGVRPRHYSTERDTTIDLPLERHNVKVRGDVCLHLFSEGEKMCQLYFHTAFVKDNFLAFEKRHVDMASEDVFHYTFDARFKVEICLEPVPDEPALNVLPPQRGPNVPQVDWAFVHAYGDTNIPELPEEDQ